jgi:hypothetical protein
MKAPTFKFYKHPLAEKDTYVSLAPPYHPSLSKTTYCLNQLVHSDIACLPFLLIFSVFFTISDLLLCLTVLCSPFSASSPVTQILLLFHIHITHSFSHQQQLVISVPVHYIDSPHAEVFHAFLNSNYIFSFFHSFFCFCMLSFSLIF